MAGGKCIRGQEGRKAIGHEGKCLVGFTLAEVLIALAIIGVAAAMTIPSLMVQLDKVVKTNQIKVFESKLQKGMDAMNLAGEIGPYYNTTEDFIKALSAHMKIVTICKAGELQNCLPYESIQVQDEAKPIKVDDIESGRNFGLNASDFKDVAGMVLADGTPMILSWNVNCPVSDPDSSSRKASLAGDGEAIITTACVKGIYDINGTKGPNLMTKDVLGYGITSLNSGAIKIAGLKIAKILKPGDYQALKFSDLCDGTATKDDTNNYVANTALAADLGINYCNEYSDYDYWAGAMQECGGVTKAANSNQISSIVNELYAKDGKFDANITTAADLYRISGYNYIYQSDSEAAKILAPFGLYIDNSQRDFRIGSSDLVPFGVGYGYGPHEYYLYRFSNSSVDSYVTSRVANHVLFLCLE